MMQAQFMKFKNKNKLKQRKIKISSFKNRYKSTKNKY